MALLRAALGGLCMFAALPAAAAEWVTIGEASRIAFSGTHNGRAFTGLFGKWTASITFDPADLRSSKAIVRVDLSSAVTGNVAYDRTLPTADWLDTGKSATASFETTSFRMMGPGRYEADGTVEIRGVKLPLTLAFDLQIDGDMASMSGRTSLKRLDFGIGAASDVNGTWVSLEIQLEIAVVARRKS